MCDLYILQLCPCINNSLISQLEAAAVNLVAGDKPADVYSGISARYTLHNAQYKPLKNNETFLPEVGSIIKNIGSLMIKC